MTPPIASSLKGYRRSPASGTPASPAQNNLRCAHAPADHGEQFRALDFGRLKEVMERPVLVDLRNVYPPEQVARAGFAYESIGRSSKYAR